MFLNENIQFFFFLPQAISEIESDTSPFKHRSYNWRGKTWRFVLNISIKRVWMFLWWLHTSLFLCNNVLKSLVWPLTHWVPVLPSYRKNSRLICRANKLTGFYMRATLALNGLSTALGTPGLNITTGHRKMSHKKSNMSDKSCFPRHSSLAGAKLKKLYKLPTFWNSETFCKHSSFLLRCYER